MPRDTDQGTLGALLWGAVRRPLPAQIACGDAYWAGSTAAARLDFGLADGLGHGPEAERAAQSALEAFRSGWALPLEAAVWEVHRRIRDTRGCVALFGRIHLPSGHLETVGIGNIEFKPLPGWSPSFLSMPGVLGHAVRKTHVFENQLGPDQGFAAFSDGITRRFDWGNFDTNAPPMDLANALLESAGTDRDDASVLVIRRSTLP
jgi:hypothetical protein